MQIVLVQNQFQRCTAVSYVSQLCQAQAVSHSCSLAVAAALPLLPAQHLGKRAHNALEINSDDDSSSSISAGSLSWSTHQCCHHHCRQKKPTQCLLPFQAIPSCWPLNSFPLDQAYGDGMELKAEGVFWLAYGNIDGFPTVPFNNPKANFLKDWLHLAEADFFVGNEAQINWHMMPCSGHLPELFCSENALRTIVAYNTHENFSRHQYGGTFQLTFGALAAHVVETGVDA